MMKLTISENQLEEISSPELLGKRLWELASATSEDRPVMVSIEVRGHSLVIGLTRDSGFVQVSTVEGLPPYQVTAGDGREDRIRAYYYHQMHYTEVQRKHEIALEDAISVAVEFAETGKRSLAVNWVEI